jgi:phage tail-like protein
MADAGARQDPFLGFRFEIRLDDLAAGGFSECGGLSVETEVRDYAEGGENSYLHKFPGRVKQTNITLKRGIVDRTLWSWFFDQSQGTIRRRNGTILVRDPSGGQVVMEWQFRRAFPTKWTGPDLNAGQNNVAMETLELAHEGLERRR